MKWMLVVGGLAMFLSSHAEARCIPADLDVYPKRGLHQVPTNVQLLVVASGYRDLDQLQTLLAGATLVWGRDRVPLKVEQLAQSARSFRSVYLRLIPARPLRARASYRLKLAQKRRPKVGPLALYYDRLVAYGFRSARGADEVAPAAVQLVSSGYSLQQFGCGPAEALGLKLVGRADDKTPAKALAVLLAVSEELAGAAPRRFEMVLPPPNASGAFVLGHGMCRGNFELKKGARYTLSAAALDWAGNRGPASATLRVVAQAKSATGARR